MIAVLSGKYIYSEPNGTPVRSTMSLMRNASLPFSAINSAAHSRIRSKRSRLRRWVGTRRARPDAPASGSLCFVFFAAIHPSRKKCLDELNTRVYRIYQIRDILVFDKWKETSHVAAPDS